LPSRIATGLTGSLDSIRALVRSNPSVLKRGLRLFDFDVRTGPASSLDAIGADASGGLAIVVIAAGAPETELSRLLDGHLWAADQRDLLGRLYADRETDLARAVIGFLVAPSFTHAFLRRLSLLSVSITPCLAREVEDGDGARRAIVEPAAPLFGFEPIERETRTGAGRDGRQPFWPEGVLPSDDTPSRGSRPVRAGAERPTVTPAPTEVPVLADEMPWPDSGEERFPWEEAGPRSGDVAGDPGVDLPEIEVELSPESVPGDGEPASAGQFETLTVEELEEFERFERQRVDRGRKSP